MRVGQRMISTATVPKPRWWQIVRMISYYVYGRRVRREVITIVDIKETRTTIEGCE